LTSPTPSASPAPNEASSQATKEDIKQGDESEEAHNLQLMFKDPRDKANPRIIINNSPAALGFFSRDV